MGRLIGSFSLTQCPATATLQALTWLQVLTALWLYTAHWL